MRKFALSVMLALGVTAQAQYQLPNSDFESDFVVAYKGGLSKVYYEPLYWHGYATIEGSVGSMGRSGSKLNASDDVRPGSTGSHSVVLTCTNVVGVKANGVMTTGRVYANSMTATDAAKNYNYSEPGNTNSSNSNTNTGFSQTFTGHPDAFRFWAKFNAASGTQSSSYPYASANAVITTNARYQDPETIDYSDVKVAQAVNREMADYGNWHEYVLPFDYTVGNSNDSQYILVSFTTNAQPGGGTAKDQLFIDDIEMIYNSEMTSFVYDGVEHTGNTLSVKGKLDLNKLSVNTNAHAATVSKQYANGTLTITVKGEDVSVNPTNVHTYTINVKELFNVTYVVEGVVVHTDYDVAAGDPLPAAPDVEEREGYSFSWGTIPATMPDSDVTVTGAYSVNEYTLTVELDGTSTADYKLDYGAPIVLSMYVENTELGWMMRTSEVTAAVPAAMPAYDITIFNSIATSVSSVRQNTDRSQAYDLMGRRIGSARSGLYIVNGKKVVLK